MLLFFADVVSTDNGMDNKFRINYILVTMFFWYHITSAKQQYIDHIQSLVMPA